MTPEELAAFAAQVRAECDAELAKLAAVDPELLPPDVRAEYEAHVQQWRDLRQMTDEDVMALHEETCKHVGRELSQAESRALVRRQ